MSIYKQSYPKVDADGRPVLDAHGKKVMLVSPHWTVSFSDPSGKRVRKTIEGSKSDAEAWLGGERLKIREGKYFDMKAACPETFKALADLYEKDVIAGKSYRATKFYFRVIRAFFADRLVGDIRRRDVLEFRQKLADTPTKHGQPRGTVDVNRHLALVRAIFKKAVIDLEWIDVNPAAGIPKLKETSRTRLLTVDEAARLLESCSPIIRPIVFTALQTLTRKAEVVGLRWSEIQNDTIVLPASRTKDGEERRIPVRPALSEELRRIKSSRTVIGKAPADYVFQGSTGGRVRSFDAGFRAALAKARIEDFHFHDLRHTGATWLLEGGAPMKLVGDILGHSTSAMTDKYVHTGDAAKAEALDRMPDLLVKAS